MSKIYKINEKISVLGRDVSYTGEMKYIHNRGFVPHGYGTVTYYNGDKFTGRFRRGDPIEGRYFWSNGSSVGIVYEYNLIRTKYSEFYCDGQCNEITNGKSITYSNGKYYGQVNSAGQRHGIGKYTWNDGDEYLGGWLNGKKHGVGKFTYADNDYDWGIWDRGNKVTTFVKYRKNSISPRQSYSDIDDNNNDYEQDTSNTYDADFIKYRFDSAIDCIKYHRYKEAEQLLRFVCNNARNIDEYIYYIAGCTRKNAEELLDWVIEQQCVDEEEEIEEPDYYYEHIYTDEDGNEIWWD